VRQLVQQQVVLVVAHSKALVQKLISKELSVAV
jgi:hypothetical protein